MRIHASIVVQRPIVVVFEYVSTPKWLPHWVAGVTRADGRSPCEQEVGARLALEHSAPFGHTRSTWEVIAYEPPRTLALRDLDEGAAAVEVRWILQAAPSGATQVWVEADLTAVGFFQLASGDLASICTRQMQDDLELLKRRLETEESAT